MEIEPSDFRIPVGDLIKFLGKWDLEDWAILNERGIYIIRKENYDQKTRSR